MPTIIPTLAVVSIVRSDSKIDSLRLELCAEVDELRRDNLAQIDMLRSIAYDHHGRLATLEADKK